MHEAMLLSQAISAAHAHLTQAMLDQAILVQAILDQAMLDQARLAKAILAQTILAHAILASANLDQAMSDQAMLAQPILDQAILVQGLRLLIVFCSDSPSIEGVVQYLRDKDVRVSFITEQMNHDERSTMALGSQFSPRNPIGGGPPKSIPGSHFQSLK